MESPKWLKDVLEGAHSGGGCRGDGFVGWGGYWKEAEEQGEAWGVGVGWGWLEAEREWERLEGERERVMEEEEGWRLWWDEAREA